MPTLGSILSNSTLPTPKGYTEGLRLRYSSATQVVVEVGSCRNAADDGNLTLAAETKVAITDTASFAGAGTSGIDATTLSATATTSAGVSVTMSASIYSETAMTAVVRSLTGTASSVGTAVTGSGTKFLSELAVHDVIRSATKGAARVGAIASDTALTLNFAFPGGDASAEAFTAYENLTIWPDTATANDERRVEKISHDGLTVTLHVDCNSNGAGKTAKIGVEVETGWYFPWLVTDGTDTIVLLSTQRTTPHLSGITGKRRIPVVAIRNNSSGNFIEFVCDGYTYRFIRDAEYVLSGGTATTWTTIQAESEIPPTAPMFWIELFELHAQTDSTCTIYVCSQGAAVTHARVDTGAAPSGNQQRGVSTCFLKNAGQAFDYKFEAATTGRLGYIDVKGWMGDFSS